jgi:hypothetical protein
MALNRRASVPYSPSNHVGDATPSSPSAHQSLSPSPPFSTPTRNTSNQLSFSAATTPRISSLGSSSSSSSLAHTAAFDNDRIEYQVKQLFEQNTIIGVRDIEASAISDLNAKKKELRMLVGYQSNTTHHDDTYKLAN